MKNIKRSIERKAFLFFTLGKERKSVVATSASSGLTFPETEGGGGGGGGGNMTGNEKDTSFPLHNT